MKALNGLIFFVVLLVCSCKKEGFITSPDGQISFSADTLYYDTVFTSVGSVTKFVRIFNKNDQKLLLSAVELAGGASSPFRINVDGIAGNASGIEILPNDSLYVFVSVQVNPNTQNLPFHMEGSINKQWGIGVKIKLCSFADCQLCVFINQQAVKNNKRFFVCPGFVTCNGIILQKHRVLSPRLQLDKFFVAVVAYPQTVAKNKGKILCIGIDLY